MDKTIPEAVELLRAFQSQFGARRPDEDEDDAETWDRIDAVCKALTAAQQQGQPAPPSAPVGVERKYPDDGNGDDDAYNRGWNDCLDAIAQQPAAVDEGMVERACDAYVQIADDCMGLVRRKAMAAALSAALAAHHQGGSDDA